MAKLWARPVHGMLILAKGGREGGGGGGGAGPPWPYARSAPVKLSCVVIVCAVLPTHGLCGFWAWPSLHPSVVYFFVVDDVDLASFNSNL